MRLLLLLTCLVACTAAPTPPPSLGLDLDDPADNLTAFVKMRGSLDTTETVVYWWKGLIHSYVPGERSRTLFEMEAYNIGRIRAIEGGYQLLTREVALYKDPETGDILDRWPNPWTGDTVDVIHVWNDPVNQQFMLESRFGPWGVPYTRLGGNRICINADILLLYPSPLPQAEFPAHSRSDLYQAAELFQFFTDLDDLNDPTQASAYAEVSWSRISDFLPWMTMADRPGHLIYHCRGYKLPGGYDSLPAHIRQYVEAHQPAFTHPPDSLTGRNETSWTYFRRLQGEK